MLGDEIAEDESGISLYIERLRHQKLEEYAAVFEQIAGATAARASRKPQALRRPAVNTGQSRSTMFRERAMEKAHAKTFAGHAKITSFFPRVEEPETSNSRWAAGCAADAASQRGAEGLAKNPYRARVVAC